MPRPTPDPVQKKGDKDFVSPTRTQEPPPMTAEEADAMEPYVEKDTDEVETPYDLQGDTSPISLASVNKIFNGKPRGLHAKLAEVIQEVTYIQKTGTAPTGMGGYKFVEAGQIAAKMRIALASRGVTMLPEYIEQVGDIIETTTRNGGKLFIQTVKTNWRLTDSESGESCTIQSMGTGGDSGDKFSPKAQTNAMKYALQVGFLLETGDDPEAADLEGPAQGPGVEVGPSNVEGVRQGGRQTKATSVQMDEIRRHAKRLNLTPMAMAAIIGAALGGKSPDVDSEDDLSAQQATIIKFLQGLSFDEAGGVVSTLAEADPEDPE